MISSGDNPVGPQITHSDFSIDHILNRAGNNYKNSNTVDSFSWLQCTRYCPPKVPRGQKREGTQKRQLGRHPRIPFTSHQLSVLEEKFKKSPYLSSEEVILLSQQLNLADVRVKIWFQNRRARERREKIAATTTSISDSDDSNKDNEKMSIKEENFGDEDVRSNSNERNDSKFLHFLPPSVLYPQNDMRSCLSPLVPPHYFSSLPHSDNNR